MTGRPAAVGREVRVIYHLRTHALDILRDLPNASHWEVVECGPGCDCGRATEAGQEALA